MSLAIAEAAQPTSTDPDVLTEAESRQAYDYISRLVGTNKEQAERLLQELVATGGINAAYPGTADCRRAARNAYARVVLFRSRLKSDKALDQLDHELRICLMRSPVHPDVRAEARRRTIVGVEEAAFSDDAHKDALGGGR